MTGRAQPPGHVCWAYDDRDAFAAETVRYLLAGLAAGERVWYVTPHPADPVTARLAASPAFTAALARGGAEVVPVGAAYPSGEPVHAAAQITRYGDATRAALAAGHTGLRVVADATYLVRTPAQRDAFTRYEHRIDRWMRTQPFRAMCAYDRSELGDEAVAEIACLHPAGNVTPHFRLFAAAPGAGDVEIIGELDTANRELFRLALDRTDPRPTAGDLVVRAADLRFVNHHALMALDEHARQHGTGVVLRTSRPSVARLASLLDLRSVRVEVTG